MNLTKLQTACALVKNIKYRNLAERHIWRVYLRAMGMGFTLPPATQDLFVSREYKFLWHVVPKVGVTTLEKILRGLHRDSADGFHTQLMDPNMFVRYKRRGYYSFIFVRNPWDRLVSLYRDKIRLPKARQQEHIKRLKLIRDVPDVEIWLFDDFVRWIDAIPNCFCNAHFLPLHCFFPYRKTNFVGRFENFEGDVSRLLNIIAPNHPMIEIPKLNPTQRARESYRDYYSDETRDIVAGKYARDLKLFNYSF